VAPENSLPAFGAAVAMGAEEIELDLWWTKDGEVVSCHDRKLSRVSTGEGFVTDFTYEELLAFDFGIKTDEHFAGMKILRFEDVLKKLACQTIMNIHIKCRTNDAPLPEDYLKKIIALIRKYDCARHVYFMCGNDYVLQQLGALAPDIARCVGAGNDEWGIVDRAIRMGCQKVQLFKPYFDESMIQKAHKHGIICNVFYSDDPEETRRFLEMGIDVILTNDFNRINQVVNEFKKEICV
jgi:glycerophosphoryl diester phosphodiesterase